MSTKNRTDLKSYFVKNAIPTEGNFADLIDSGLNQSDDGVFKLANEALAVVATPGAPRRVLRLFANSPATNPDWVVALNPPQNPADPTSARAGLGFADGTGNTRLFVEQGTGRVGVGTNAPQAQLHVEGTARFAGQLAAPGGLSVDGVVAHVERDGAFYRHTDGQCYITVDERLCIRDMNGGAWAARFDTNTGGLELKGSLSVEGTASLGLASTTPNYNAAIPCGFYQHPSPQGRVPDDSHGWVHMIAVRHSNLSNHHQLQIASSYSENSRLFFRKIGRADLADGTSEWHEVLTIRGGGSVLGSGSTVPGATDWKPTPSGVIPGVMLSVDTSSARFQGTPRYLTSLCGDLGAHMISGAGCVRRPTNKGFAVMIHAQGITPEIANQKEWHVTWIGVGA